MKLDYEILCYEVLYKRNRWEKWNHEYFSQEEKAYQFYVNIRNEFEYAKMQKINICVD